MNNLKTKQMSETLLLGVMLAIVGGFLDAYTYMIRGGVFANAQTGNIVFLGLHAAKGEWKEVAVYSIPVLAFVFGVIIAETIRSRFKMETMIHWRQLVIIIEIVLLFFVGFIPKGEGDVIVNIIVSFVCAMQVETFRKVNGNAVATTMCTGNLRSATEQLYYYKKTKDKRLLNKCMHCYGVIVFFILGASFGTFFTRYLQEKAILFCVIVLMIVFLIMFMDKEKNIEK